MSLLRVYDQCLDDESEHVRRVTEERCVGKVAGGKHPKGGGRCASRKKQRAESWEAKRTVAQL